MVIKPFSECRHAGTDPGRGESGSSHGQIFSTLEYFVLRGVPLDILAGGVEKFPLQEKLAACYLPKQLR